MNEDNILNTNTLTPEEMALAKRVSAPDDDWRTITEDDVQDFSLAEDPYKLPKPAAEQQARKKFAFRWCEATPRRVDELRSLDVPAKWYICNRVNTPFLEGHFDPVHGGVQKLDQILLFKPWWMHVKYQEAKMLIAKTRDQKGDLSTRHGRREEWGEWRADDHAKIDGGDIVMAESEE